MIEYNVKKSKSNFEKHDIDFETATGLWQDPQGMEIPARTEDELRFMRIAKLEGKIWSTIFTLIDQNIRIISVRRARKNEEEIYNSI